MTRSEQWGIFSNCRGWIAAAWMLMVVAAMPIGAQVTPEGPEIGNPHGDLSIECSDCHTVEGWAPLREPLRFDHATTPFPLTGVHASTSCVACHTALIFDQASGACATCHAADLEEVQEPNHDGLPLTCESCHLTDAWSPATFDHAQTLFALEGAHRTVDCAACHADGYSGTPSDCFTCHESNFNSASEPSHEGFPTTCEDCHQVTGWSPATFDHNQTAFPLLGAHLSTDCQSCHADGYAGTPQDCFSCHESDYNGAADPSHDGFPTTCEDCHTVSGWQPANFDHNQTAFPLLGAHLSTDCQSCHADGYAGTPQDCFSCHESDYNGASDPSHDGFPTTCEDCHTVSGWQPASFDHNQTAFPLQGAHLSTDCASCHADGYSGTPQDCFSCHESDYNGASDPSHDGFPTTCEDCHQVSGWSPATFDHNQTAFPLQGAHLSTDCASCHADGYSGTPQDCFSCHEADYNGASDPDHDGFATTCEDCHTVSGWQPASFDHNQTAFPLQGAHQGVDCASCHTEGYSGTPQDCFSCHESDYNGASDPDHDGFPTTCEDCHTVSGWQPASFDHNQTAFPLQGAHQGVDCASCHTEGYSGTPQDCFSCHEADYNGASDPDHDGFATTCEDCHTVSGWQPANFDHNQTAFPLQGAHQSVDCASCHTEGYSGTPTDCFSCHESDYNGASDPDHDGFATTCEDCHTVSGWQPANFDHNQTAFPLQGAHQSVDCASCHTEGYSGTPTDCFSCHEADYNGASDPDHDGFPTTCEDCHTVSGWQPANFDHNQTAFPLQGAHLGVDCASCHTEGYSGTPTDCFSCHEADYNGASDPDHDGFATTCEDCHSVSGWEPANFDHNQTAFPLRGAHLGVDCQSCHAGGYAGTPQDCFSCHESDYNGASDPDHDGFPTTCEDCHSENGWEPANFDHNQTAFPLQGAHLGVDCESCHTEGYSGTPTDCFSCHEADYNGASDPDHDGFPTTCEDCHTVSGWEPANFDHNQTAFPLQGAHRTVDCQACHSEGYSGTPTDCFSCHETDYNGAADPDHDGFPTTCEDCHTVSGWEPANFDHNQTAFPLQGAHRTVDCQACHSEGYSGTPTDCFSCHEADYNGADDPDHDGFPTTCEDCHSVNGWQPASFDHNQTAFPLRGAHQAVDCASCHAGGYAGTPTDCFSCHESDYNGADDPDHDGFPTTCEDCHSENGWEPADFDHNQTAFPLRGAHLAVDCQECHSEGYGGTPTACFSCHESDYNGADDPDHDGFPTTCEDCHSENGWEPANFDHNQTAFPLDGAHLSLDCQACHAGGYAGTPTDCFACHADDYNSADPDHTASGFPTTCETCHNTNDWDDVDWDHDDFFPIYSGSHRGEWNVCEDCHVAAGNPALFECIFCHEHNQNDMDSEHDDVNGYVYESHACLSCHPDGEE